VTEAACRIAHALARRLGVPIRSGRRIRASKIPRAQLAYEFAGTLQRGALAGVNFAMYVAG
jgi:trimethylamine--corrinoid protein Co-methyltransferase